MYKELIEEFGKRQEGGRFACPRCGSMKMDEAVARNALSRRADVYICDACGMEEALEDAGIIPEMPLRLWAISKAPELWRCGGASAGEKLILKHVGRDSWDRPVYQCNDRFYVDVDPRPGSLPEICTKAGNDFDGEPCDPIPEGMEIVFVPERDVWNTEHAGE